MIKNNRNNEQIYGRNDMIMLDPNNKIYGSLGIADKYVMKTEEGTRLALSNSKLGSFGDVLTEFNIYGRSEQKQYRGKNLLKIRDGVQTTRGVTVTAKDGAVALKGTATETGWTLIDTDSFVLDGTCILSSNITGRIIKAVNKSYKEVMEQNISKTLENEEVSRIAFVVKKGEIYDVSNILLQIEKGSEVTSYEPYVGGKPSPSPDYPQQIKSVVNPVIKVCGKNLFDFSRLVSDGVNVMDYDNQTITIPAYTNNTGYNQTLRDLCPGITPGIYVFSVKRSNPESGNGSYFLEAELAFNFNIPTELTDELLDNHIAWYNNQDSDVENVISEIQIERGTEATDYEPYHEEQTIILPYTLNAIPVLSGGNVTIDGQQYIADYVDVDRGKLYKKVKRINVKDVEDKNVAYGSHSNGNGYLSLSVENVNTDIIPMSNQYRGSKWTNKSGYVYIPESGFVVIVDDRFIDRQTAIKLVQDTYVFYALASQIEINLAPEVIEQYKKLSVKAQTTIIENNYNTWMKATYKSTESV